MTAVTPTDRKYHRCTDGIIADNTYTDRLFITQYNATCHGSWDTLIAIENISRNLAITAYFSRLCRTDNIIMACAF